MLSPSTGLLYGYKCFCSYTEGKMQPFSWNGVPHGLHFCRDICILSSLQGCIIICLCCVFVCKSESCCIDVETLNSLLWVEETTGGVLCLGGCRVPGLSQSALFSVAGSPASLNTNSCCPLLGTTQQLVVNPVDYTLIIIRLFNPTPLTLYVRLTDTNDQSPC